MIEAAPTGDIDPGCSSKSILDQDASSSTSAASQDTSMATDSDEPDAELWPPDVGKHAVTDKETTTNYKKDVNMIRPTLFWGSLVELDETFPLAQTFRNENIFLRLCIQASEFCVLQELDSLLTIIFTCLTTDE